MGFTTLSMGVPHALLVTQYLGLDITNALSTLTVGVLTAWGQRRGEGRWQGYTLTDCLHIVDICFIAGYANHPAKGQEQGVPVTRTQGRPVSSPTVTKNNPLHV